MVDVVYCDQNQLIWSQEDSKSVWLMVMPVFKMLCMSLTVVVRSVCWWSLLSLDDAVSFINIPIVCVCLPSTHLNRLCSEMSHRFPHKLPLFSTRSHFSAFATSLNTDSEQGEIIDSTFFDSGARSLRNFTRDVSVSVPSLSYGFRATIIYTRMLNDTFIIFHSWFGWRSSHLSHI